MGVMTAFGVSDVTPESGNAIDQYQSLIDEVKAQYPEHRLSFGYIGNCERWGDDRTWYIFTRYKDAQVGHSVSFYVGGPKSVRFDDTTRARVISWIEGLSIRCKANKIY